MIGNTIETDLVGEHIELLRPYSDSDRGLIAIARGRCRAVTSGDGNDMLLWLEVVTDKDARTWGHPAKIGDVYRVSTDDGSSRITMRLIKEHDD